jgi:hypothetical protein
MSASAVSATVLHWGPAAEAGYTVAPRLPQLVSLGGPYIVTATDHVPADESYVDSTWRMSWEGGRSL